MRKQITSPTHKISNRAFIDKTPQIPVASSSNNSSNSSKRGTTNCQAPSKIAPTVILLKQDMHKAPKIKKTNPNQSSSHSHSEGSSGNNSAANTPCKKKNARRDLNNNPQLKQHISTSPKFNSLVAAPSLLTLNTVKKESRQMIIETSQLKSHLTPAKQNLKTTKTIANVPPAHIDTAVLGNIETKQKIRGPPTIVFNLDTAMKPFENAIENKEQQRHTLGYKSFIQKAAALLTQDLIPLKKLVDEDSATESIRQDYLNQYLDFTESKSQNILQNKSPNNLPRKLKPAISPPGNKIVIKKSEIKFSLSPASSPQPDFGGKRSPGFKMNTKLEQVKAPLQKKTDPIIDTHDTNEDSSKAKPKQLAVDYIKRMLNEPPSLKGNSPKKDVNPLKLSLSGSSSPYSHQNHMQLHTKSRVQKSSINFVHDMKKHGIDKDIDSVRATRQFLDNNSPQSVSPMLMMPILQQAIQKHESRDQKQRTLKIKTSFKTDDVIGAKDLGSDKSAKSGSYLFPFHRRSRSLSPPREEDLLMMVGGSFKSLPTDLIVEASFAEPISTRTLPNQEGGFKKAQKRAQLQLIPQQKKSRITPGSNGGPVILPDRDRMESAIKAACGSPGGIFFGSLKGKNAFSFSLKKQTKLIQKQAIHQKNQEQEELERRILGGTEVEDWLYPPLLPPQVIQEEVKAPHRQDKLDSLYHFSRMGFVGDTDDLDGDDVDLDMEGNDDWMFQTFQKSTAMHMPNSEKKSIHTIKEAWTEETNNNPHDQSLDEIPQDLLNSLDINHNIRVNDEQSLDEEPLSELEGEGAIPSESMIFMSQILNDNGLEFSR